MKTSQKYLSWGILVFGFVIVFFHRLAIGSVRELLIVDLGLDSVQISNVAAMTFYGYALMQLPVGVLVDTIGVRKICTYGMALTAFASLLFAVAEGVLLIYFARFLVGIGTSVIIVSIMKIQATLFSSDKYSTLSGLTSFFGNFGAFFATIPLSFIAITFGWRKTFVILSGITFVLAVMINFFVKEKNNGKLQEKINIKEGLKTVLTNKKTYPDFLIMVFFVGSLTAVLGLWGGGYLENVYNVSSEKSAYYLSFITYGFIIGAPIVGKLSDLLGGKIKLILLWGSGLYVLLWSYIILIYKGQPPVNQWPILFFVMGLFIICHILVFSNVKSITSLKYTGIAIALVNIGEFVGSGLVSTAMGYAIKYFKLAGYSSPEIFKKTMILVLITAVLSFLSVCFMHDEKKQNQVSRKQVS